MRLTTTLATLAVVALSTTAGAQVCLGTASFSAGPFRADGALTSGNSQTTLGVGVSGGIARSAFGSLAVNRTDVDGADESATGFGISGGYEIERTVGTAKRSVSICPVASITRASASAELSAIDEELDMTMTGLGVGISAGTALAASPTVSIFPFGTLSIQRQSVKFDGFGMSSDDSETGAALDLGVGLLFNRVLTVRPLLSIPIGFEGADPMFGVSVHFNFGR